MKLARQPDRLAAFAPRSPPPAPAQALARSSDSASASIRVGRRKDDRAFDRAPRLEHVARLLGARLRDEGAAIGMQRDDAALREHDQHAADLRPAAVEGVAERRLRKLRPAGKLLLEHGRDDAVENRRVRQAAGGGRPASPTSWPRCPSRVPIPAFAAPANARGTCRESDCARPDRAEGDQVMRQYSAPIFARAAQMIADCRQSYDAMLTKKFRPPQPPARAVHGSALPASVARRTAAPGGFSTMGYRALPFRAALLGLASMLTLAAAAVPADAANKILKIGFVGVTSGPAAAWGTSNVRSMQTLADWWNFEGGVKIGDRPTTSTSSPSTTRRIRSGPSPAWRRWPRKASTMSSGRTSTTAPRPCARWPRRPASSTSPTPSPSRSTPSPPRTRCSAWSRATSLARRSTST